MTRSDEQQPFWQHVALALIAAAVPVAVEQIALWLRERNRTCDCDKTKQ